MHSVARFTSHNVKETSKEKIPELEQKSVKQCGNMEVYHGYVEFHFTKVFFVFF